MKKLWLQFCTNDQKCHEDRSSQPSSLGTLVRTNDFRGNSACPNCGHIAPWYRQEDLSKNFTSASRTEGDKKMYRFA
jgi:hypothetical protein